MVSVLATVTEASIWARLENLNLQHLRLLFLVQVVYGQKVAAPTAGMWAAAFA